jgi:lipoic acid synthetase
VKSGMMLGLGEEGDEIRETLGDLRRAGVTSLTLGQYLAPSRRAAPIRRYVHPDEFDALAREARAAGFLSVASGPLVRSSYHAEATLTDLCDSSST